MAEVFNDARTTAQKLTAKVRIPRENAWSATAPAVSGLHAGWAQVGAATSPGAGTVWEFTFETSTGSFTPAANKSFRNGVTGNDGTSRPVAANFVSDKQTYAGKRFGVFFRPVVVSGQPNMGTTAVAQLKFTRPALVSPRQKWDPPARSRRERLTP